MEQKLDTWLKYSETLQEAHDKIAEMVLSGFHECNLDKIAIQKIAGNFIRIKIFEWI